MHTVTKAAGPPPTVQRQRVSPWATSALECKQNPGEWYTAAGEHAPSVATYLRREWGLEVRVVDKRSTTTDDGKEVERCTLWLRWTPESQAYSDRMAEARDGGDGGGNGDGPPEETSGVDRLDADGNPESEAGWDTSDDPDETDWEGAVLNPSTLPGD